MSADLTVQTPLIRQAADELDDAAGAFRNGLGETTCPLTDSSLGSSALAREVVAAAARRVVQTTEAGTLLAGQVGETAARLRAAAAAFEAAESAAIAPPR